MKRGISYRCKSARGESAGVGRPCCSFALSRSVVPACCHLCLKHVSARSLLQRRRISMGQRLARALPPTGTARRGVLQLHTATKTAGRRVRGCKHSCRAHVLVHICEHTCMRVGQACKRMHHMHLRDTHAISMGAARRHADACMRMQYGRISREIRSSAVYVA